MSAKMNEMASGCCVCSDERGWTENPLVYCDGVGCNIGVHKACYGIVTVPSGNWYCRKCESQERSARVRCELCPSKEGALKRTDTGGWAHVVCGLYIPEVRFGSVTTMEPIVLSQIPTERYNKVCYICEQNNRGSRASMGACMQCNKTGCKLQFHVTCAQTLGLLCEEPGNYMDNVKYCGYCQEHYMKMKKSPNVKSIPAFKSPSLNNFCSEESTEKKLINYNQTAADLKQTTKRKLVTNKLSNPNGSSKSSMADRKELYNQMTNTDRPNGTHNLNPTSPMSQRVTSREMAPVSSGNISPNVTSVVTQSSGKNDNSSRFTTSNFVESVITPSESVFADIQKNKKRKPNEIPNVPVSTVITNQSKSLADHLQTQLLSKSNSENVRTCSAGIAKDQENEEDDDDEPLILKISEEPNLGIMKCESMKLSSSSSSVTVFCPSETGSTVISSLAPVTTSININTTGNSITTADSAAVTLSALVTRPHVTSVTVGLRNTPSSTSFSYLIPSSEASDSKSSKYQNNSNVPHMLGNRLNPTSSMAQKMFDTLNNELEAHSIFMNSDSNSNASHFVGPPLYNKIISSTRAKEASKRSSSPSNGGPLASLSGSTSNFPQSLEELLEKQWEQGGTFLMEQAQHFDIASLLTCLHKLREENMELEEHIRKLKARRDHLLGVNARLAMPLAPISQPVNNIHTTPQTKPQQVPLSQQNMHPQVAHVSQHQQHASPLPQHSTQQQQQQQHQHQQQHHISHPYQTNPSIQLNNLSEGSTMRNVPLSSSMYTSVVSTTLLGPHSSVYQNPHSMENGSIVPSHHQHGRITGIASLPTSTNIRQHSSSSNSTKYQTGNQQSPSNQGVVVRASNLPVSDIPHNDKSWCLNR